MKTAKSIAFAALLFAASACSTTRVLPEGKYRLAANKVEFTQKSELHSSDINSYIRQQPGSGFIFGWNPFLNIYNWRNMSGKGFDKVWQKIGTAPVEFSDESMANSVRNIEDHLTYLGYYNSEVNTRIDTVRRLVKVHYIVKPGTRYRIDSIAFVTPPQDSTFANEFESDKNNILVHKGDYLSEKALEGESSRSAAHFNGLGYYDFNKNHYFFEADTLGGRAVLKYEIRNYTRNQNEQNARKLEKYHFGDVTISHSPDVNVHEKVLKKLNYIVPGDLYNPTTVNNTYSRMSSLRIFNGVGVDLTPRDSSAIIDCNIRLSESSISGVKANLEMSTSSTGLLGISPQLNWYHKNIFNGGEWLSIGTKCDFQFVPRGNTRATEASVNASLSFPRFLGLSNERFKGPDIPRTEISTSFSYQDRPEYKRSLSSLTFGYSGSWKRNLNYQFYPFRAYYVRLYSMSPQFHESIMMNPFLRDMFNEHIDVGVGGNLTYTSNSDIVPKTAYHYAKFALDLSGNLINLLGAKKILGVPYSQYFRTELTLGKTFRFGPNNGQALATRFVGGIGLAYGQSDVLPYDRQFFAGGASSMRGWQARTLGPGSNSMDMIFIIPSQTGDMKLEFDMEYRFKLFWKLDGALFAETGNIWELRYEETKSFYKTLAADWGAGLRLNFDFILVRVDLGIKMHDPTRDEGSRWLKPGEWFQRDGFSIHFGVGYPF